MMTKRAPLRPRRRGYMLLELAMAVLLLVTAMSLAR